MSDTHSQDPQAEASIHDQVPADEEIDVAAHDAALEAVGDGHPLGPEDVEEQLADAHNRLLRTQAELENFRKRARRELDEERRFGPLSLIRDILPVLDNLSRAVESSRQGDNAEGLLEGVQMVLTQFEGVLEQYQCRPIDATGAVFDPNCHEAILQVPSPDHPPGTVVQVTQIGYQVHDRVVRPSQVIVAASSPADGDTETSGASPLGSPSDEG